MSNAPPAAPPRSVVVIGGGFVGRCCAWLLSRSGHRVTLVAAAPPEGALDGSGAALGLLMADVYRRRSGRGWRLRQHSLALLAHWQGLLAAAGHPVALRRGLLLLAQDAEDWQRQQALASASAKPGPCLELRTAPELQRLEPVLPPGAPGGLWSARDGQLDPIVWGAALEADGTAHGLLLEREPAAAIAPTPGGRGGWRVQLAGGTALGADSVVVAAGLGSGPLLASLGIELALEPVLGQALELELAATTPELWPGSVVWQGINLVPRPFRRLWIGATLEPGESANPDALTNLAHLQGKAPDWLRQARTLRHWQGLRVRPVGQPAPVLIEPRPGLLVSTGHYRNGILLAPASAAWVAGRIEALNGA
ncbi:FAD-binding oxidoreductase [Cyanobium sp. Morenito 9A2]|uniref:NAD(P)/FAD-dependent oxidoreductase n=1 Tax=Cyanobium sp. Morenito 9A2 TaxID=2823718 RepID=UPI0020CEB4D5|nr:FAD-dependent oxidoreductase [Cyanobium sp. Morenito 9A2]MCP9850337.1 FAD-binding oxidoreductase [Cyanobium sp. Morenito 9A2]